MTHKIAEYRAHALAAETKAFNARTEETRRAWQIIARDWTLMADRLEARQNRPKLDLDAERLIGSIIAAPESAE